MISTRILYIAALLSMCSLLAAAFFALRGIRKEHKDVESDLERMAWKAHQEAEAVKTELEARSTAYANLKIDDPPVGKTGTTAPANPSETDPLNVSATATEIADIPSPTAALPTADLGDESTISAAPAYIALLQGILLGATIVLLAKAQARQPEDASLPAQANVIAKHPTQP